MRWLGVVVLLAAAGGWTGCVRGIGQGAGVDGQRDATRLDLTPPDAAGAEATVSVDALVDGVADAPSVPVDTTSDGPPGNPCAGNATPSQTYTNPSMVACRVANADIDQCTASTLCSSGWHLCTTLQYRARGGQTTPATNAAWLAGCVRDGSTTTVLLTDTVCSACSGVTATAVAAAFGCSTGKPAVSFTDEYIGVIASGGCWRVADNHPKAEGYWEPLSSAKTVDSAVCCR